MKLDGKDHRLVSILISEGRLTNRELAERVGLSQSACLARVRRLERGGVIVGYRAVIGRAGAANRLEGWADIRLLDPSPGLHEAFISLVEGAPEIVEAHRIAGHYDYKVRFSAGDIECWHVFRRSLEALGGVVTSRFSILVEPLK